MQETRDALAGVVVFEEAKWTGETIANAIDDMGFDATLVSTRNIAGISLLLIFYLRILLSTRLSRRVTSRVFLL